MITNLETRRRLHRIRKGWDCPHCKMHFGWRRQFEAHVPACGEIGATTRKKIKP